MKKLFIIAAALAVASTVNAQINNFGIGTQTPNAQLQVNSDTPLGLAPVEPIFPGLGINSTTGVTGSNGGSAFLNNYKSQILVTNTNTGTLNSDGLLISLHDLDASISLQEKGVLKISTLKGKVFMAHSGQFGIGDTLGKYKFYVKGTSAFNGDVTMMKNLTLNGNLTMKGTLKVGNGMECDAQGNLKVKHLRVTLTDWPDYVFGGNHELKPLGELGTYINQHQHLPGVPSAQDVEEQGADLGEMNRLLMEKVEELTLYIIDLQKQIDELKNNQ